MPKLGLRETREFFIREASLRKRIGYVNEPDPHENENPPSRLWWENKYEPWNPKAIGLTCSVHGTLADYNIWIGIDAVICDGS